MATLILVALVVVLVTVLVWQNRHRLPTRGHQTPAVESYDECEVCGHRGAENVTLTAVKDRSGGGLVGGSSISATFCPEHLPHRDR